MTAQQPTSDAPFAVAAERYAASALRWARPLIILGWVIVVGALSMLAFGILVAILTVTSDGSGFVATGTLVITSGFAVVALLQGAALLMVGSYVRMRASWTRHKIAAALASS